MRLPRDMDAATLIRGLARVGYTVTRQTGSHIRLSTSSPEQHHITVPNHSPIKLGTFAAILGAVEAHLHIDRDELLRRMTL
jgi:predicted RNA binding protein YcfA (HicA-like mRNA interferase family)